MSVRFIQEEKLCMRLRLTCSKESGTNRQVVEEDALHFRVLLPVHLRKRKLRPRHEQVTRHESEEMGQPGRSAAFCRSPR
jgi:hypothetical protein